MKKICENNNYNDIKDYYFVDDNYNIISICYEKTKILKTNINNEGYHLIRLRDNNNKTKTILVHRLIATLFIPNPNNKPQVNHKDENKIIIEQRILNG